MSNDILSRYGLDPWRLKEGGADINGSARAWADFCLAEADGDAEKFRLLMIAYGRCDASAAMVYRATHIYPFDLFPGFLVTPVDPNKPHHWSHVKRVADEYDNR